MTRPKKMGLTMHAARAAAMLLVLAVGPVGVQGQSGDWRIESVDVNVDQRGVAMAMDDAGTVYVAYNRSWEGLKVARRTAGGWTREIVAEGVFLTAVSMDVAPSGQPGIALMDAGTPRSGLWYYSLGPAGCQGESAGGRGGGSSLAIDSLGRPHIAHEQSWAGSGVSNIHTWWDGSDWQYDWLNGGPPAWDAGIALDSLDYPRTVFQDWDGLMHIAWDGSAWESTIIGRSDEGAVSMKVAVDAADRSHVAFVTYPSRDLKYAIQTGTGWQVETIQRRICSGPTTISLDLAPDGTPHIAYQDAFERLVKHAVRTDGQWDIDVVDAGRSTYMVDMDVDGKGVPHIVYYNRSMGELRYATVPEPATLAMILAGAGFAIRRKGMRNTGRPGGRRKMDRA